MGLAQHVLPAPFLPDTANQQSSSRLFQPVSASGYKVLGRTQHPILYERKQVATQKTPNGNGSKRKQIDRPASIPLSLVHFLLANLADLGIL